MKERLPERPAGVPGDGGRAAFLARLTAGATHEIRNVLAIVKESAGLVQDLVDAGTGASRGDKVGWALERIQLQVTRGTELSTALNRVMHGLDHETEMVELAEAVQHAGLLSRRFAHQNRRKLELEPGPDGVTVTTNALDLYMALVATLEWCLARVPEGETVVVGPEQRDGAAVRFRAAGSGFGEVAIEADEPPARAAARVGGRLESRVAEGTVLLRFH